MNTQPTLPVFGIERHRLLTDGVGVSTLVGAYGCPLSCKYCLNPHAWNPKTLPKCKSYTVETLYEKLKIDSLYFLATNGGVTFGGGESLLHAEFIKAFRDFVKEGWRITVETSLNVSSELVDMALYCVDDFIIDVKTMNADIYKAYTGRDNSLVLTNLEKVRAARVDKNIHIRLPEIPNFTTDEEIQNSLTILQKMGFTDIEVFPYTIR